MLTKFVKDTMQNLFGFGYLGIYLVIQVGEGDIY